MSARGAEAQFESVCQYILLYGIGTKTGKKGRNYLEKKPRQKEEALISFDYSPFLRTHRGSIPVNRTNTCCILSLVVSVCFY